MTDAAITIGRGKALHAPYRVGGNLTGSLCNPYAWETSRLTVTDGLVPTCPRCAKATTRAAEQAEPEGPSHDPALCSVRGCTMAAQA
jgi:hypothetical protein